MSRLVASASAVSLTLTLVASGIAEPTSCRSAITRAAAKYLQIRVKALAKCEDRVVAGRLAPATVCELEAGAKLAAAAGKLRRDVERACGGADRLCGGDDDDGLGTIGWDLGACPDPHGGGCVHPLVDCGDVVDCIQCAVDATSERLRALYFDALLASTDGAVVKCQRGVGKAAVKFLAARSKALATCWDKVSKGQATAPCPAPGDGKAAAALAKAESKKIASICKACGGADRGCDGDVGTTPGTGGDDDLAPGAIGFVPSCPAVTVPGVAASCAGAVGALADLVGCVDCTTAYEVDCADALAVPWSQPLPAECAAPPPGGTPTATATPTVTPTPAATPSPTPTAACDATVYTEDFAGADGSPWPAPWVPIGSVDVADLQAGRARFRPTLSGYSLARLHADLDESDVEARLTVEFEDVGQQGVGFYVRQNGGYLQSSSPHGQGYAVFVEGFRGFQGIGVWREVDGVEQQLLIDMGHTILNGTRYRVRFQVEQATPGTTVLRAKLWPEADAEPGAWDVEYVDDTPALQGVSGGTAADSWSSIVSGGPTPAYTLIDDVEIVRLCVP